MQIDKVKDRLEEIDDILCQADAYVYWDSFSSCSKDVSSWLHFVNSFYKDIQQPFISSTLDGKEVVVEWHKDVCKLMISFYGDGKYSYYYRDDLSEKFCNDYVFSEENPFDEQIKELFVVFK